MNTNMKLITVMIMVMLPLDVQSKKQYRVASERTVAIPFISYSNMLLMYSNANVHTCGI